MKKSLKERVERVEHNLTQQQHRILQLERDVDCPPSEWNQGDWTTFENIEIGDTIGGIKLTAYTQIELLRAMGKALKVIEDHDHLGKVLNL